MSDREVSLVPTWKVAAQIYSTALENGSREGVIAAREDVQQMGEMLDWINANASDELKLKMREEFYS